MIADGRQMVSLISVHGRGSLSDVYGLLHFSLVPVGFTGVNVFLVDTDCPDGQAMISYSSWFIIISNYTTIILK